MTGPITQGKDFNYFTKLTVANTTFDAVAADVMIPFRGLASFSIMNEGGVAVEYSFNGSTVHGDSTPGEGSEVLVFEHRRVSKIWFKVASGSTTIRIEA